MLEYLKKWMYINDVNNDKLLEVGKIIEETKQEPVIFTSKAEVLYYFWLLIKGKLKLEDFIVWNDIYYSKKTYQYKLKNAKDALDYIKYASGNKIYILDYCFGSSDFKQSNVYFV